MWVGRAWGWQSEEAAKRNKDIVFVHGAARRSRRRFRPDSHWDLWLGPAPERPFHEVYFPGPKWYRWWDFGSGTMSDLGSHWNDLPFWALKLRHPLTIEASGPPPHPEIAPASMTATYEYGARGELPPVQAHLVSGRGEAAHCGGKGRFRKWDSGVLFIGDKGMLLSDYGKHVLLPEEQVQGLQAPRAVHSRQPRPSPGMDSRLQDRRADDVQLRLQRPADRGESPRQRRLSRREEADVGPGKAQSARTHRRPRT